MLFWRFWLAGPGCLIEYHYPIRYVITVPLTKFTRGPPEFPCFSGKTWKMRQRQSHQWFWHQSPNETHCSTGAHVDYGIRLDVADVRLYAQLPAVSLGGADDARGDRVLQGKRAADRNHKFPWSQISWLAQSQHGKLLLSWNREAESERKKNTKGMTDGGHLERRQTGNRDKLVFFTVCPTVSLIHPQSASIWGVFSQSFYWRTNHCPFCCDKSGKRLLQGGHKS